MTGSSSDARSDDAGVSPGTETATASGVENRDLATAVMPLAGWGRCPVLSCRVGRPEKRSALGAWVRESSEPLLARGLGRSYGDAALNPAGATLLVDRLNRYVDFNEISGMVRAEAGVTIADLIQTFLHRGWFPPVTPGTRFVTLGGSVACDIHGKNHHRDGSLHNFVRSLRVLLASGEEVECSREVRPDLFFATTGGMGLTGIITEVELQLRRVETAYFRVRSLRTRDLDDLMQIFADQEPRHQYAAAWVDCLAPGAALGRGIVLFGDHAAVSDLNPSQHAAPLQPQAPSRLTVPLPLPVSLVNPLTARIFNSLRYALHPIETTDRLEPFDPFLYPLDHVQHWNRLYGQAGFMQYQCVVPPENARAALTQILELCRKEGWCSPVAVLKRFGPGGRLLSFPITGYTLALDMPVHPGVLPFLERLDARVVQCGGRVYLSKDARLSPAAFREMYPQFAEWLEIKRRYDPENRFRSALSDRLKMGGS